jgi:hypothetical protein
MSETLDIDAAEFERDLEPFGPLWAKPRISTPCRVICVGPRPSVSGAPGFSSMMAIGMETPEQRFEMCIDDRSARFLLACLLEHYIVKPLQSSGDTGTPSADALKPSASSQSPAETLAHAELA